MSGVTVLGIDASVAQTFDDVKSDLRAKGQLIDDFDILIAATALTLSLTIVTNNTAHLERVAEVKLENWA